MPAQRLVGGQTGRTVLQAIEPETALSETKAEIGNEKSGVSIQTRFGVRSPLLLTAPRRIAADTKSHFYSGPTIAVGAAILESKILQCSAH